ncbi:putative lipoprotein [Caballeronia terrestris]|jgi:type VI secretion system protein VasD|uniref:Lipoprotein n=1 Tax=Caballeronia terrestris TaxID=1226301 RepID=A0A158KDI7_9BURK|nr:type VI secretion system lipoprotein TssJ [Caballeronia terrestris]SAL79202.1 putative lipoprotein [Caballeronia terrestris]
MRRIESNARSGGFVRHVRRACLVALLCVIVAGCKSPPPPPPPTVVKLTVSVLATANPDRSGRPSPIVVRVYELKSTAAFDSADFFTLYAKDQAALGADLNAKNEFLLRPGESKTLDPAPVQPGTKFIAVVAAFRDIERSRWRATFPVPPNKTSPVAVKVDAADVGIVGP